MRGDPADISWPLSSFPGASPQESAGRLINVYAEPLGEAKVQPGALTPTQAKVWRRSPGLSLHATSGQTGYRGGLIVGNLSYETFSGQAVTVDSTGTVLTIGSFPGTRKVSIARNNAASPNVVAVDLDNGAYVLSGGGAPSSYNGSGAMPQAKCVWFQDGYLFFGIANRQVFATGVNTLTMNALTNITLQAKSSDTLMRGIPFGGLSFIFTTSACEVWQDTANAAPGFPYSRLVVIEYGLIQENAIAGFEDGFGVLMWAAQDYGVYQLVPGSMAPQKVSPPDLDRLIEKQAVADALAGTTLLEAGCYTFAGKKFWTIQAPGWSWEFNLSTQKWNERSSLQGAQQGRWRATGGHPAFGKWLMGDTITGNLLYVDDTNYADYTLPLLARMESAVVQGFPSRIRIARADFEFVPGVGIATSSLPNAVLPSVAISVARDGGNHFGNPWVRSLGAQGRTTTRVTVKNAGMSSELGDRWRWDISDPVYVAFMGATQSSDPRNPN